MEISLKKKRLTLNNLIMIMFFLYMISFHIFSHRESTLIISKLLILVLLSLLFLYFLNQRQLILGWRLFFVLSWNLIIIIGYFWSPIQSETFTRWLTIFQLTILLILLSHYLDTPLKLQQAVMGLMVSYIVLGLYMIYEYGFSILISGSIERLGNEISQINILGMSLSTGVVFAFYYFYQRRKKYMIFIVILLSVLSSLTGSRKAIVIMLIGIVLILFQDIKVDKKRFFRNMIVVIIFAILLSSLSFFDLVFDRIESALTVLSGKGELDGSTRLRLKMIETGLDAFMDRPILGTGVESFQYYWFEISGKRTYSHNNYIELLVSGGVVAFLIYYGTYFYLLINVWRRKSKLTVLLSSILLITVIVDFFVVSYYFKDTYVMLAIYFAYVYHYEITDLDHP